MMRASPTQEMRIFLCTQIADEARHVRFFDRFYDEVGVLEADNLQDRLDETSEHLNPKFNLLFDEMLERRVDRLASEPEDLEALVEAVTIYHMVIEGMLALTGPALHHRVQRGAGHAARASSRASTTIARDEHRHVAFGARFLREMAQEDDRYATPSSARWPNLARRPTACCAALVRGGRDRALRRDTWTRRAPSR